MISRCRGEDSWLLLRNQVLSQELWLLSKQNYLYSLVNVGQIKLQEILRDFCFSYLLLTSQPLKMCWVGRGEYSGVMGTHSVSFLTSRYFSTLPGVDRIALPWAMLSGLCLNSLVSLQKINDSGLAIHHSPMMQWEYPFRDMGGRQSFLPN